MLNKGYDVIISVLEVTNKISSSNSNYIADVVMWLKFGNSSIYMREVIITLILWGFNQKNQFFWGVLWLKFSNLRLVLGMTLKFYTSVAKELKLKVIKFWGLIPTYVEVTGEKLVKGAFCSPPPYPIWIELKFFRELY